MKLRRYHPGILMMLIIFVMSLFVGPIKAQDAPQPLDPLQDKREIQNESTDSNSSVTPGSTGNSSGQSSYTSVDIDQDEDGIRYIHVIDFPQGFNECLANQDSTCISQTLLDDNYRAHCAAPEQTYSAFVEGPYYELLAENKIVPKEIRVTGDIDPQDNGMLYGGVSDEDLSVDNVRTSSFTDMFFTPSINNNNADLDLGSAPWSKLLNSEAQCNAQLTSLEQKKKLCDEYDIKNEGFLSLISFNKEQTECAENQKLSNSPYRALELYQELMTLQDQGVDCHALTTPYKDLSPTVQSALTSYANQMNAQRKKGFDDGQAAQRTLLSSLKAVPVGNSESSKIAYLVLMTQSIPNGIANSQTSTGTVINFFKNLLSSNNVDDSNLGCSSNQEGYCLHVAAMRIPAVGLVDQSSQKKEQDAFTQTSNIFKSKDLINSQDERSENNKQRIKNTTLEFNNKTADDDSRVNKCLNCNDPFSKALADIIEGETASRPEELNCSAIKQNPESGSLIGYSTKIDQSTDAPLSTQPEQTGILGKIQGLLGRSVTDASSNVESTIQVGGEISNPEENLPITQRLYFIMPYDPFEGGSVANAEAIFGLSFTKEMTDNLEQMYQDAHDTKDPSYTDSLALNSQPTFQSQKVEDQIRVDCENDPDPYEKDLEGNYVLDEYGERIPKLCTKTVSYGVKSNQEPEDQITAIGGFSKILKKVVEEVSLARFPREIVNIIRKPTAEQYLSQIGTNNSSKNEESANASCSDFANYKTTVPNGDAELKSIIRKVAARNSDIFPGNTARLENMLLAIYELESGLTYRRTVCNAGGTEMSCGELSSAVNSFGPMQIVPQQCNPGGNKNMTPAKICNLEEAVQTTAELLREYKNYKGIREAPASERPYLMAGAYNGLFIFDNSGDWDTSRGQEYPGSKCGDAPLLGENSQTTGACATLNYCECAVEVYDMSYNTCSKL